MNTPLVTWSCTVGLFIIILLVRLYRMASSNSKNHVKMLSLMTEREEFFAPGDPDPREGKEEDYDEFDDL